MYAHEHVYVCALLSPVTVHYSHAGLSVRPLDGAEATISGAQELGAGNWTKVNQH